jgi:hypothetical protein
MANDALATYLNDHLAGSVAGLEVLDHLAAEHSGTATAHTLAAVRDDIQADQQTLETLLTTLQIAPSAPRRAAAWLTTKVGELKLRLDDPAGGALHLLEGLEALSLGIEGKRALWEALAAVSDDVPELRGPDYGELGRRAAAQRRQVETLRLAAAREAFRAAS